MAMRLGVRSISQISGLYSRMPTTAACFFIGVLAVTGIPPFSCFWSKLTLVVGIMELKGAAMPLIAVPYYLEVVLAFFWFLRVGQRLLFGEPSPAVLAIAPDGPAEGTALRQRGPRRAGRAHGVDAADRVPVRAGAVSAG